jgi:TetR/AcrR family transcriptional regulator
MLKKRDNEIMSSTEQKIIEAAMKSFVKEGYRGATTKHIAREAGVNEITLFRKFKSKENILQVALNKNKEAMSQLLDETLIMTDEADLSQCLRNLWVNADRVVDNNILLLLLQKREIIPVVALAMESMKDVLLSKLREFFEYHKKRGKLREVNVNAAALAFISFFAVSNPPKHFTKSKHPEKPIPPFDEFIEIFMNGISCKKQSIIK